MTQGPEGLPASWGMAPLGQLTNSTGGGTPDTREPRNWDGGTIPWVSPKDMKVFNVHDSTDKVTAAALKRLTLVPQGSVLVVVRSGILSRNFPHAINLVPVTINQDMRAAAVGRTGPNRRDA